jgi:site-specific DNA-methyltransferase (adenine-specific)/adenine-specific DNA-methyltransferase
VPTLNWIGKSAVVKHHQDVPYRLLEPVDELSCGPADSGNLIVQGDNLHALKALLPRYAGQVKCIYIDPPYNTGNEDWVYDDNVNSPEIRRWLGQVVGKEGETLDRHDRWLCMMYPRLVLLRQFLRDDGVIFVSIDDHELANLLKLMEEIFQLRNYVEVFSWIKTETPSNLSQKTKKKTEYILCFQAGRSGERFRGLQRSSASDNPLLKSQNSEKTLVFPAGKVRTNLRGSGTIHAGRYGTNVNSIVLEADADYENGLFKTAVKMTGRFVWTQENLDNEIGIDGSDAGRGTEVRIKTRTMIPSYEKPSYEPEVPSNLIGPGEGVASNETASTDITSLGLNFQYSKPESLIRYLINMICDRDSIVLDSFAGSGTTAHAVLRQNAEDGGNRRFILVEMKEDIACYVTAERVKRVAQGYTNAKGEHVERLGGGFQFCRLSDEPLFTPAGQIREDVRFAELAEFTWFSETGTGYRPEGKSPLLGVHQGRAIYLLYNGILGDKSVAGGNVLTAAVLDLLPPHDGPRVIYAAASRLGKPRLNREGIVFKQTPYALDVLP